MTVRQMHALGGARERRQRVRWWMHDADAMLVPVGVQDGAAMELRHAAASRLYVQVACETVNVPVF